MDSQETLVLPGKGEVLATPPPFLKTPEDGYLDPEMVESQWRLHTTPQELTREAQQSIVDDLLCKENSAPTTETKQTLEQPKDDPFACTKEKDGTNDADVEEKKGGTEDTDDKEKKGGTKDTVNKKKDGTENKGKKKDKLSSPRKKLSVKRVRKTLAELKANHRRCSDAWHAKWIRKGVRRTPENEKLEAEKAKRKKPTESKHKRSVKSEAEKAAKGNCGPSVKPRAAKSKASKRGRSDKSDVKSSKEKKTTEAGDKELKLGFGDLCNRGGLAKGFCLKSGLCMVEPYLYYQFSLLHRCY